ncbi:hypothetical protein QE357_000494 [Siphonobacter sp. BAB-5404]|nr:hypothetical protein [Siphonobacter sp. SORGH_AS_0500]
MPNLRASRFGETLSHIHMKFHSFLFITFAFLTSVLSSCTKETPSPVTAGDTNDVILEFDNRVGAQKLVLGETTYQTGTGESFTVSTFNYFISNVSLKKTDGSSIKFPNQYFLIRQVDNKTWEPVLKNVPAGDYQEVTFTIGVDSAKSVSPVAERTGVLDEGSYGEDGMYWGWNSGYIFLKLEGTSPTAPANGAGIRRFQFHVGGFGGMTGATVNNLRTVTLPFPQNQLATVRKNIAPTIHVITNLQKLFSGKTTVKIADTPAIHMPAAAVPLANNYVNMFTVDHTHND